MADGDNFKSALNDEPAGGDLLGYRPYAEALTRILTHADLGTPFTVGIFGPWGTGKSSFMVQLTNELKELGEPHVFFQPWIFDDRLEVWKALILTILQYLDDIAPTTWSEEPRLRRLATGVAKLTVNKMLEDAGLKLSVDDLVREVTRNSREAADYVNTFRRDFQKTKDAVLAAIEQQPVKERAESVKKLKKDHRRLFVFVDDLDRCTPDGCVMVLEAIKLFFGTHGCVFILGIDADIVQQGIEIRYQKNPNVRGRDYLEKLIQLPFTLPPVAERAYSQYVGKCAEGFNLSPAATSLIAKASDGNPRRTKRLINCLHLVRTAAQTVGRRHGHGPNVELDQDKLALLLVLQARFPIAYQWLTRRPTFTHPGSGEKGDVGPGKAALIEFLKLSGDGAAEATTSEFLALWAEGYGFGVPLFVSSDDLMAHLRLTGLVETSASATSNTLHDSLDIQFKDGRHAPPSPVVLPPPPDNGNEAVADLREQVGELEKQWNELWRKGPGLSPGAARTRVREAVELADYGHLLSRRVGEIESRFDRNLDTATRRVQQITWDRAAQRAEGVAGFFLRVALAVAIMGSLLIAVAALNVPLLESQRDRIADDVESAIEKERVGRTAQAIDLARASAYRQQLKDIEKEAISGVREVAEMSKEGHRPSDSALLLRKVLGKVHGVRLDAKEVDALLPAFIDSLTSASALAVSDLSLSHLERLATAQMLRGELTEPLRQGTLDHVSKELRAAGIEPASAQLPATFQQERESSLTKAQQKRQKSATESAKAMNRQLVLSAGGMLVAILIIALMRLAMFWRRAAWELRRHPTSSNGS